MLFYLTKDILIIQNIPCEHLGTLQSFLSSDGYKLHCVNGPDMNFNVVTDYDALIILGGPMSVYDNYDFLKKEQQLIRNAVEQNLPILGICLGSQLIANALGGNVYKGSKKEIGWYYVNITREGKNDIFHGLSDRIKIFHWHGDTFNLPSNAVILAKSNSYIQAFRIKSAIGIQFHIEVTKDMIFEWINQYSSELKKFNINYNSIIPGKFDLDNLYNSSEIIYKNFNLYISDS